MDILKRINLLLEEEISLVEIISLINRDCSKFLKGAGRNELYRGTKDHKEFFFKGTVRKDRKPTDMPAPITKDFNIEFEEEHGVANIRNISLFASGSRATASEYGKIYRIFPIGNYTYWWNPDVEDLYQYWTEERTILPEAYKNTDLIKAIKSDNEIMFVCDEYYAIDANFSKSYDYVIDRLKYGSSK